jgi:hypothetical protein
MASDRLFEETYTFLGSYSPETYSFSGPKSPHPQPRPVRRNLTGFLRLPVNFSLQPCFIQESAMKYEKKYERAKNKLLQAGLRLTFLHDQNTRTQIIYHAIHLEGLVGEIIAWHFCPNEESHLWFNSLIFQKGEISFGTKISILDELLQQFYPDIYAATPGLITRLNNVRRLRNEFAHAELVLEESKLLGQAGQPPQGIYLKSIKNGKVVHKFWRQKDMEERLKLATDLALFVHYVYAEVKNRVTGGNEDLAPVLEIFKKQSPHLLTHQTKPPKNKEHPNPKDIEALSRSKD